MDESRQVLGVAPNEMSAAGPAGPTPTIAMLFDGGEMFGLPHAVLNLLDPMDRTGLRLAGLFLGPGVGYDALASCFTQAHQFGVGPLFPLRRAGKPKYDPIYLGGRLRCAVRSLRATAAWARAQPPAILHAHSYGMAWLGWRATRNLPVRRVFHAHGPYPYSGRKSRRFIRFVRRAIHRVLAISRFVADTYPAELRDRVRVLHNGVPVQKLRAAAAPGEFRARYGVAPDQPLIGVFGAIVPRKGQTYFVEAAARVAQKHPAARFALVGGTTDAFEQMGVLRELGALIGRLGLADRVIQTGFVQGATRWMVDFDITVMPTVPIPTQIGEGFGLVLAEAMAQGVASIATTCGAPPEIIDDGVTGLLVPPRDAGKLADAMLALLDDPARRARVARAGAASIAARYDAPLAAARLRSAYEELLSRPA